MKIFKRWAGKKADQLKAFSQGFVYTNSIGMEFMPIPAGYFIMGSDPGFEDDADEDEGPMCKVHISKPFYMGKTPVTQAWWAKIMGDNPSRFTGEDLPVDSISWDRIQEFIRKLNALEAKTYRLPTEAEWEYAARAGSVTTYFFGENVADLVKYAWFRENSGGKTHPVGLLAPNAWGLHDIFGNVWEWVQDLHGNYPGGLVRDPGGVAMGSLRVLRGGCWSSPARYCRSANRTCNEPSQKRSYDGFRLVLPIE